MATDAVYPHPIKGCGFAAVIFIKSWILLFITIGSGFGAYFLHKWWSKKHEKVVANTVVSGVSAIKQDVPNTKFSDVEGIDELMSDINRIVDCLKNPEKYKAMGANVTKGIILYGPPGTGKTLIAKAIAGESGVPFISMAGSDFVNKYVGVGADNVRKLYKKARASAPCIVFIDEIDAVATQRGRDENSERDQTINALLSELDGFDGSNGIVTICATNRLDMLDEAFKRSGRFDLKLAVSLPDKKARINILKIHSKNKKLADNISLESLALRTSGFSGADLAALLNESASLAAQRDKRFITKEEIDDSFRKIVMQGNKVKILDPATKELISWHESGHALVTKLLTDDSVSSVTIIGSSSGAGGVTFRNPNENNILKSKKYLYNLVKVMYAGRAAEELYFKNKNINNYEELITIGASNDIRQATSILKDSISSYGMGTKGLLDLSQFNNSSAEILNEVSELSIKLYKETVEILSKNIEILKGLATALYNRDTLDENEIDTIIMEKI